MNDTMILHHYDASPYAEKIRLMFGLTNTHWHSLLSPVQPPRPNLDPLTGGYRRIPVAQVGADIFCDTAIIAREVATATHCPALDVATVDATAAALMEQAEKEAFFAAIGAVKPLRLLGMMIQQLGPIGAYRFIKDRAGLLNGSTARPPQGAEAKAVLDSLLTALEIRLADSEWIGGDTASIADFAIYHPLWLHVSCNRRPLEAGRKVAAWYQRVSDIGHGRREEITQDKAFAAARNAEPRPLPESVTDATVTIGALAEVAPSDYGVQSVAGVLAAITEDRIILARDSSEFGKLHVHFPRAGYSLVSI
jgi:glutathione S-transferase